MSDQGVSDRNGAVERWLAWRYLATRQREGFVSFIAIFSLIGIALGVATLGSLYLALQPHSYPHAFAAVEYIQMGIVALLAVGAAILPRFTQASADAPVIDA